jgi:hypothetical protein
MGRILSAPKELRLFGPPVSWTPTTFIALATLLALWGLKVYSTWAAWGSLTIDSGHEMYIPAQLAEGKQLYRDVWFMYGPASAYFNSYLYRLFGVHLSVLYWAGSVSALVSAIFLYLVGMRLSSWLVGWTAGTALLLEAFQPTIFCFPLPYAFAAVYGCMLGCVFLWIVVCAAESTHRGWILAAGLAAAIALLDKPEFGIACYGTLLLLIVVRSYRQRSMKTILPDSVATLPGILLCAVVIYWMVSIRGVEFITQENVLSWPTSHFMKTYGKMWLETHGFRIDGPSFVAAFWRSIAPLGVLFVTWSFLWWRTWDRRSILLRCGFVLGLVLYFKKSSLFVCPLPIPLSEKLSPIFLPQDMLLYVAIATVAIWGYFFWRRGDMSPVLPLTLTFACLTAFRILMGMQAVGYPIFYNGPVILCYLLLVRMIIPRSVGNPHRRFWGEAVICFGCLLAVHLVSQDIESHAKDYVPFQTDRGLIRTTKRKVQNYEVAIRFMKEKAARGETVLSIPEDTSLYFLSGTQCPTRIFDFSPGVVAPGKMTEEVIREIDRAPVQYLIWSNREYPDYGVPVFGKDFDQPLGDYLKSHYRPVGLLTPDSGPGWAAEIWQRTGEVEEKQRNAPGKSGGG